MAKKSVPLPPVSPEARAALLQIIEHSQAPLLAKTLATELAATHPFKEAQLTAVLDEFVATGVLQKYSAAKGKPRYWDRDLRTLEREAVTAAAQQAEHPLTAKELTTLLKSSLKLAESRITEVLDELVTAGSLYQLPGTTAKGKPRFWNQDVIEFGRRSIQRVINTKGPQTLVSLKKELKGLNESQINATLTSLQSSNSLVIHPPLGSTKQQVYGTRPPAPGPYFKEVGAQLTKLVALLKVAQVPTEELRRVLVQLLDEAGISFGTHSTSASDPIENASNAASTIDIVSLMKQIEPGAERGALIGARDLRRSAQLPKSDFDHAVLQLARQGRLSLHRHDYVASLSPEERDEMVTDGEGTFYVGMALRSN